MKCTEFREQAWQWMEGERRGAVAAHVEACAGCRTWVAELEQICLAAQQWGTEELEPPPRLKMAILAQLEAEGRIRRPGWFDRLAAAFVFVPRPALAAVSFALLFVLTVTIALPTREAPVFPLAVMLETEAPTLLEMREKVDLAGRRAVSRIATRNQYVAASYRENLAIVDKAIEMCEKTVREEPGNELAREYLYAALRQKAELVATIMERNFLGE